MTQAAAVEAPARTGPLGAARGLAPAWALAALVALAALLRLPGLDGQSFWHDEAFTVVLVREDLGGMLSSLPDTESTPPLYYLLAWGWAQLLGSGEAGLRSLSALFGIATVPVAYLIGRELAGRGAAIIAGALVAVSPYLVWYSQEARAYALYALVAALSFLFFLRACDEPTARRLGLWAGASALALATHYFAAFLVVPEAAWLVARAGARRRHALLAAGAVGLTGAALLPLALAQRASGHTQWVNDTALVQRSVDTVKRFLTGPFGTPVDALAVVAALLAATGLWFLLARAGERARRRGLLALAAGGVVLAIPLVLALVGFDYFFDHYVIAALVPLLCALAAGLAAAPRRAGPALAFALGALLAAFTVTAQLDEELQREDWREVANLLGRPDGGRAIVVDRLGSKPLDVYLPRSAGLPDQGATVREVALAESFRFGEQRAPGPPSIPGFMLVERHEGPTYRLMRYRAAQPAHVTPHMLAPFGLGRTRFFVHQP